MTPQRLLTSSVRDACRRFLLIMAVWLAAMSATAALAQSARPADRVLTGQVTDADVNHYIEAPFDVPAGVTRITVAFTQDGAAQRTTIDLGLFDPQRFRGWSGGDKTGFTVAESDATPSYQPGAILPGRWRLLLGVPNIRKGVVSHYRAEVRFGHAGDVPPTSHFSEAPLRTGPGWYRGDLHMHTGHSDGRCLSQSGVRVPCPVFRLLETATAQGLDFVAITDHNTTSHAQVLRELQPWFDRLLLIPGREMTTFTGHANAFGVTDFIDFRVNGQHMADTNAMVDAVHAAGGLFSINHPTSPTGEVCMGCGWTAPGFDFTRADAVEVVNGGSRTLDARVDRPGAGLAFWYGLLNRGFRPTAVGGSDSHDADRQGDAGGIGAPATVVHADALSERAIKAGICAGHVFVDTSGSRTRRLEVSLRAGDQIAGMGDRTLAAPGVPGLLNVHVLDLAGGRIEVMLDGSPLTLPEAAVRPLEPDATRSLPVTVDGGRHWLAVNVRDAAGRLVLIGNPVYLGDWRMRRCEAV